MVNVRASERESEVESNYLTISRSHHSRVFHYQPWGSVCRILSSSSCWRRKSIRSLVAVGNGERVGPTGRPIIIIAPFSDDGYWSLNSRHSRDTLYWHSRAVTQSLASSAAKNLRQKLGAMAPVEDDDPQAPSGKPGSRCSTPMKSAKSGRILIATRDI